ncbi:MAG: PEGA domain-containing protein [Candidatus Zixiibacteriota bacterium]
MTKERKLFWLCSLLLLGGIGTVLVIVSCASIVHGTRQKISVNSVPSGAKVVVKDVQMATTPAVIELKRKESNIVLRFEKEGYEPVEMALKRSVDGWIAGNILLGGLIGLAVDFIDGAAYKLSPSEVDAVLAEAKAQGMNLEDMSKDGVVIAVDLRAIRK